MGQPRRAVLTGIVVLAALLTAACGATATAGNTTPPLPTATPTLISTPTPTLTATPASVIPTTPTLPPVQLPQFTTWSASADDPAISFTFTLDGGRTSIIAYSIHLTGYTCGGSGGSANGTVSGTGTWAITNRMFAINGSLLYNGTTTPFKIEGSFNVSGTFMDGVWMFSPNGASCSTAWRSSGS